MEKREAWIKLVEEKSAHYLNRSEEHTSELQSPY